MLGRIDIEIGEKMHKTKQTTGTDDKNKTGGLTGGGQRSKIEEGNTQIRDGCPK